MSAHHDAQHYDEQPASAADYTQARPYVIEDVGPDGRPQAMLVTPATETIVDRDTARCLISELLAVLTPGIVTAAGGITAGLLLLARVVDAVGDSVSTLT
jgi:hypothetical protein